jgi:Domain of unknown function (DUF4349)
VSPLELVDDRFEKLASELRASRPVASDALRERVGALSRVEPASPRWTFRLPSRRVVLGLAGAALLASFVAASVSGLTHSSQNQLSAQRPELKRAQHGAGAQLDAGVGRVHALEAAPSLPAATRAQNQLSTDLPTATSRLQRYDAALRLRVKDVDALSNAARRAMNLSRSLGGYVASVHYATRGGERGGATLVLRVPVASIQAALGELTSLGTILRQETGILDVTKRADRESRQIAKLERQLAEASPEEAPAIRLKLKTLRAKHASLLRSARLARITLALTTPAKHAAAPSSRFDRTLDDAGSILARELEILLYALVVAGPLLLLGGAAIAAGRAQRRRSDRRLLERA